MEITILRDGVRKGVRKFQDIMLAIVESRLRALELRAQGGRFVIVGLLISRERVLDPQYTRGIGK